MIPFKRRLRRLADRFVPGRFPRIVDVKAPPGDVSKFEVTNSVEAFRVEELGGEEEFLFRILEEIKPSDVFFDIGACVGLVSIAAAKQGASVAAFEPDPGFRGRLLRNLSLNRLESVQVVDWAVSDEAGETTLYTDGVSGSSPCLRSKGNRKTVSVRTKSIDEGIREAELPYPDVIKMDIEGAEIFALRGMSGLLESENRPRFVFIETHPEFLPLFGANEAEVISLLETRGYQKAYVENRNSQRHFGFKFLK